MITFIIVAALVLLVIPDLYLWWVYVRESGSALLSLLWWLPMAAGLSLWLAWSAGWYADWIIKSLFVILLSLALPKFIFMFFSLAGLCAGHWLPWLRHIVELGGVVFSCAVSVCAVYGFVFGTNRLEVREVTVSSSRLPESFDGYRIVHISDLHTGSFGSDTRFMKRLVEVVNGLGADAVLFTGDIVNASPDELIPYAGILSGLEAADGVWSVAGNHDYCEYARYDRVDGAMLAYARVMETEREMGWRVLSNEHRVLRRGGDEIVLAGVENCGRPPFPSRGDLGRALEGSDEGLFTILMSHDPSQWRREVLGDSRVDLMLSGHTHGMQLEVCGWSPSSWSYSEWGGLYSEAGRMLYVSKGVGGTVPFRFGAWPEVTLLILRRL